MALVDAVMKRFPDVDRMMAETIVMAHENGKLKQYLPMLEETEKKAEQKSSGSISIEQWSEDKSAVSSSSIAA